MITATIINENKIMSATVTNGGNDIVATVTSSEKVMQATLSNIVEVVAVGEGADAAQMNLNQDLELLYQISKL